MTRSKGPFPPLSPVLLAGLALRPVPPALIQPLLNTAMSTMATRHPDIFERLESLGGPTFLVDPVDLPFCFLMDTDRAYPGLKLFRHPDETLADATIRGPLALLLDLLEGRIDGDAQFFSRDLVIEGDTSAVLALRNAVDGADVNVLSDILSLLGPASGPAEKAAGLALGLVGRFGKDLDMLRDAALSPLRRQSDIQARTIAELEETVAKLKRQTRRARPAS